MTTPEIQWVPFSKRALKEWNVPVGYFAFVGSDILGAIYPLGLGPEQNWYGQWCGERIGSCYSEEQARANIEHKWKSVIEGHSKTNKRED